MTIANGADGALYFLPLGGSDEIGMNLYLYGLDGKWLMVDLGVSFGDESTPGIEVLMADTAFIEERRADLLGIVITHAHEDHMGAVQYLWPRLRCPVYATPFSAEFLRHKLQETKFASQVPIREVPLSGTVEIGPFRIELVSVTHSIPEPNALLIGTRHGTVVHSGDWKLDEAPLVGRLTDVGRLRRAGDEGVLALICDSTNALEPGRSRSEGAVRDTLTEVIAGLRGRIAVTCFATNVARLSSIAAAAHAAGRHCALVGRSLWRVSSVAKATGYLSTGEEFVSEEDAGFLPEDRLVMICTGSQGEPRSALSRIAEDSHPHVVLEPGDTVIYSARAIPGNEKAIFRVQNALSRRGVRIITPDDAPVHASGHPARDELVDMYQWLRPRLAIPVHGEPRMQEAHAQLARQCQVPDVLIPRDGGMIRLAPGPAALVDTVHNGRLALDGTRIVPLDGGTLRGRFRMMHNGAAVATLVVDDDGLLLARPQVALMGLGDEDGGEVQADLEDELQSAIRDLPRARRRDDESLREAARLVLRRTIKARAGKKPLTSVQLVRV